MRRLVIGLAFATFASACSKADSSALAEEATRRDRVARAFSADAGSLPSWNVSNTDEINYADGFSLIMHESGGFRGGGFRWMGQRGVVRLKTHGARPMHLLTYGWVNVKVLQTTPTITAFLDGRPIGTSTPPPDTGLWGIDVVVPAVYLEGHDRVELTVVSSSVAWPWAEVPGITVIAFNNLSWTEAP